MKSKSRSKFGAIYMPNSCNSRYDLGHFASRCSLLANLRFAHLAISCSVKMQKSTANCRPGNPNESPNSQNNQRNGRVHLGFSFSGRQMRILQTEQRYGSAGKSSGRVSPDNIYNNRTRLPPVQLAPLATQTKRCNANSILFGSTVYPLNTPQACALLSPPHNKPATQRPKWKMMLSVGPLNLLKCRPTLRSHPGRCKRFIYHTTF